MTTLQRRISLALTAIVMLFVIVQGYLAYSSVEQQEDDLVDDIVISETKRLVDRIAAGDTTMSTEGRGVRLAHNMMAWLIAPGQPETAESLPTYLANKSDGPHMLHRGDQILHAVVATTPAGKLVVQYDATENEAFVYRFGLYLLVTGLLFIALAWVISVVLARVVVAPFRRLALQLQQWSPGNAAQAVGRSDEETMLLQAFDQAQRRLDESHAREREFAANVRHEVRTPLTALRTDAEMLLLTETLTPDAGSRLRRMISAVDAVTESVEAAHSLSRSSAAQTESVDLSTCVNSAWASLQHLNSGERMQLRNRLASGDRVDVDRYALMTIVRNLLRNAIEHASPGSCEVRRTTGGIIFSDDGPGIAAERLPHVFDRHYSGRRADLPTANASADTAPTTRAAGAVEKGLGLAIARQTASQQNWTLEASSGAKGGCTFRLKFDSSAPSPS